MIWFLTEEIWEKERVNGSKWKKEPAKRLSPKIEGLNDGNYVKRWHDAMAWIEMRTITSGSRK